MIRTQALLLACLLAAAPLCHGIVASPASIAGAADKLAMGGMELRRPMIDGVTAANRSADEQHPTEASDGTAGHRLHLSWLSLLSEATSPLARDHSFVEQGVVLDHLLVFLVVLVVYIFR
ncbi:uncharacterized protein [Lolium perenne]|uniref:uncharacterized protein n=1 Tax=Lolium perenne TaxID=4522 RepID=UPI0021EB27D6|nr:uncharacterized protein LOC127338568 [Lolium perenne]